MQRNYISTHKIYFTIFMMKMICWSSRSSTVFVASKILLVVLFIPTSIWWIPSSSFTTTKTTTTIINFLRRTSIIPARIPSQEYQFTSVVQPSTVQQENKLQQQNHDQQQQRKAFSRYEDDILGFQTNIRTVQFQQNRQHRKRRLMTNQSTSRILTAISVNDDDEVDTADEDSWW
jgi:hypothetical protein